jgi:hypothetical protein
MGIEKSLLLIEAISSIMEGYAGYAMLIVYLGKDFLLMILTLTKMVSPINTD